MIVDYKNKLIPKMKNEPMSLFFSKVRISILGAMVMWAGKKIIKDVLTKGLFIWFINVIMENMTSQTTKDMQPTIRLIVEEIEKPYFQ